MRYVVVIDMYVYADSDEQATAQALEIAGELDYCHDNKAAVISVGKQQFGSLEPAEQIYPARTKPKNP